MLVNRAMGTLERYTGRHECSAIQEWPQATLFVDQDEE